MRLLNFLVETFVNGFGITRPKPEQQRIVALTLGGVLLLIIAAAVSTVVWMLANMQR